MVGTTVKTERKFQTKYGYFTADGKEYVITRHDTPRPWVNVISNGEYGLTLSQTGSGFSWWGNANLCRINTWLQDLLRDEWGKYLYIMDQESREFWSVAYKPTNKDLADYEVRHGVGYTTISGERNRIRSSVTYFAVMNEPMELWKLTLRNESDQPRTLSLFSYFELCLGNAFETHREFHKTFIETEYDPKLWSLFGRKRPQLVPGFISTGFSEWPCHAFHAVNREPVAYEGDKEKFLGMYRSPANPLALSRGQLSNTVGKWNDSIASLQVNVALAPHEEKTIVFMLGRMESKAQAKRLIERFRHEEAVDQALEEVKRFWDELTGGCQVQTPDDAFNFMTNTWLKYQAISGRLWARTAYYQSSGAFGFRDQLQDSHVFLPLKPDLTKRQIRLHAAHQFKDGTVYHWWHNLSEFGVETKMTDDLLWIAYVTLNYLDETQDVAVLKDRVNYLNDRPGTIYEHCCRAIDRVLARCSRRGLPLIGEGDWNDGMNLVGPKGKGESIWLGQFLYGVLIRWAPLAERQRDRARAKRYLKRAAALKTALNKYGWDGQWYLAATKDDGSPVGGHRCKEGKIHLNPQTWAIIHETAPPDRAKRCIESIEKLLDREYGPILLWPAYKTPDVTLGYVTRYAPGARENGGVYSHGATWAIQAECLLKRAERAYQMYAKICPVKRGMDPDLYYAEPYVMPGDSHGPDSAHFGRGEWTWYTGSAAWLFRVSTEWLLGVRSVADGLVIDPCIPASWDGFTMKRLFRGAIFEIEVKNPHHVSSGVKEIRLDGRPIASTVIPPQKPKTTHRIEAILG